MNFFTDILALVIFLVISFGCTEDITDEVLPGTDVAELYAGTYSFNKTLTLPSQLDESSGLIIFDSLGWSFNDSGNEPVLYGFDLKSGSMKRQVRVENAVDNDWEDITQDEENIYIGNFGNNDGDRKNLKIYIVKKSDIRNSDVTTVSCDSIEYNYADQESFVPAHFNNSYDCEAFIAWKDSLYLFTKDWVHETTSLYTLPVLPGKYTARHVTTFNSGGLVTGADFNPADSLLVFSGYSKELMPFCYIFYDFEEDHFFAGKRRKIILNDYWGAQTEGVAIQSKDSLYFTSESSIAMKQSLFLLKFGR